MRFQPGQSGNPAGRPKGSVNRQLAMLREAVEKVLPLVVKRALAGDAEAQRLILERGLPKFKAVETPIEFDLPEAGDITPARAVLQQAAAGELSLSHAKELVGSLLPVVAQEEKALAENKPHPPMGFNNAYLRSLYEQIS